MLNYNEIKNDYLNRDLVLRPIQISGGWPIPYLRIKNLKELLKDAPQLVIKGKFKEELHLNEMLNGGLKIPHMHIDREIFLLDKPILKNYLHAVADEIESIKDFSDLNNYVRV